MKLRLIRPMLVAACMLITASSASAISFHLSKEGTVKATTEGLQEVVTPSGKIVCEEVTGSGRAMPVTAALTLLVTYGKCEAFGLKATISTGTLSLNANGTLRIGNSDKFIVTTGTGHCSVLIQSESETSVKVLGTIKYTNNANGTVGSEASIKDVNYEVHASKAGSVCGEPGELNVAGYRGKFINTLEGGTIKVE
jgi:hypothetical protein